jgi:DNA-binding transcriptional regulator LsrR (DeoR family)
LTKSDAHFDIHAQVMAATNEEVADRFCAAFGGRQIYIPADPRPTNRIVMTLGLDAARAICAEIGPGRVIVPLKRFTTHRKLRAFALMHMRNGLSNNKIAEALGCHTRTVTRIARELREQGRLK